MRVKGSWELQAKLHFAPTGGIGWIGWIGCIGWVGWVGWIRWIGWVAWVGWVACWIGWVGWIGKIACSRVADTAMHTEQRPGASTQVCQDQSTKRVGIVP